ncbi:MAG: dihydrodipicolinate synthase family protein, partial [Anaerolineae bacterium]|nr:dihydrodipicolinate synthase family protein [Anaerolineae bacterium]
MFAGIYQILHTPFDLTGAIDWDSCARQIEFALQAGAHGLVVPAMASEFFTLSDRERFELVEFALKAVARRVPVLVGVQGQSRQVAVTFAEHAARHDADGLMAMPPYLRKAGKAELEAYYRDLAGFDRPLMIQNAPALSGAALSPADVAELLAMHENIAYVKEEAPPILQRIVKVRQRAGATCRGVFGGANGQFLIDELERGAAGNMPAGGFIDIQVKIYDRYQTGDKTGAAALHQKLLPLLNFASMYGVTFHKYLL